MQSLPPAASHPPTLPQTPALAQTLTPTQATRVARVTGASPPGETLPNPNRTDLRDQLLGTDLGIMWAAGGRKVMIAFGDSYGREWGGDGGGPPTADWRSNTLALSRDAAPEKGLVFTTMIHDRAGHAGELIPARRDDQEVTVIPTAGVTVGARHYLYFMSVHQWGPPSLWQTNSAGIAYSDDGGRTWSRIGAPVWKNSARWDAPFQQVASAKSGGYVYLFGTPNGRRGAVSLARVSGSRLLDKAAYQYWDGRTWRTGDEAASVPIVTGPAGELSVEYNSFYHRWLMLSFDMTRDALVLRDSAALTGPWSDPKVLASSAAYPGLYGGFIDPLHNSGQDLYFTLSQWGPYNVFWMHSRLTTQPL